MKKISTMYLQIQTCFKPKKSVTSGVNNTIVLEIVFVIMEIRISENKSPREAQQPGEYFM